MSRIDELIAEHCAEGVEFRPLADITGKSTGIKWACVTDASFKYIDLSSVDRVTRRIGDTISVTAADAPSRARQIVRTGDVIFATTRPAQMRWAVIPSEYDGQIASTGYCVMRPNNDVILTNFLAHILGAGTFSRYVESNQVEGNYPSIPDSRVREFRVPVPPLEVQREIVRILDTFSKMEAELEAELEARKQQYEHYQYQVFNDLRSSAARLVPLSEIGRWYGGGTPSKSESRYWSNGTIPWISPKDMGSPTVTQTEDYITNEAVSQSSTKLVPKESIAIVVRSSILEHTLPIAFVPIESSLNQDMKAVIPTEGISARYVFHAMRASRNDILRRVKRTGGSVASLDSKKLWKFEIPVPNIEEQKRVNEFFDRFDTLTSDLSAGLPAELVARRQQYEYYRDKLLTFRELEPTS